MTTSLENPETPTPEMAVLPTEDNHRGNGKIARLPKLLRDQVNRMLDDGLPYHAIIEKLEQSTDPPLPYKLLEINISRWKDNGYQKYLRHQEWRDQLRILRENGSDMSELTDGPKFQETLVQIALTEIFRVLEQGELKPDSLNYIRLFNALARLNREALGLRKYNDQLAKEEAALKQLDPKRKIVGDEQLAIVDTIDHIMEMPRPRPANSPHNPNLNPSSLATAGPRDVPARSNLEQPAPDAVTDTSQFENPAAAQPAHSLSPSDGERARVRGSSIENPKSKIKNPSSPLPSRPCQAETSSEPCRRRREETQTGDQSATFDSRNTEHAPRSVPIKNQKSKFKNPVPEHCLECGTDLPPVPPHSLRRPEDHCPNPNCGMRLPDIGLCTKPGFDHCLSCGATQPALLPGGERPRPYCHKCGERLHNPELPPS